MRRLLLIIVILLPIRYLVAQNSTLQQSRLKVFIDCHSGCDMTFIRSEINIVDFLLDRQAADVHVLINDQNTGGGGDEYQIIFFGQNKFRGTIDTLRFINEPNNTRFEERDLVLKYIKLGLVPFILKTNSANGVTINMKDEKQGTENAISQTKDPWNYWVFRIRSNGSINLDEVYKETYLSTRLSANRVTEEIKLGVEIEGGKNRSQFEYEDDNGILEKYLVKNNNYEISQYLIKSIDQHWSWGYEANFSRNTFSNNRSRKTLRAGIEYNIYPYKLVNTKSFTIAYTIDGRRNSYLDTTLYDKLHETLWGHRLEAKLRVNQKWGTVYFGADYHNYFHNWKFLNMEMYVSLDIRITGGLSFNIHTSGELVRDQIYLPKAGATAQEVLTRRRQLASGYRFSTFFGISYRFGSKLNNFVNPRFD